MPCRDCGRPGSAHCSSCQRRSRGTTTTRGYGYAHRLARDSWQRRIEAGDHIACRRCGEPVVAGQPWDLGHDENRVITWPEHRACNRGTNRRSV